MNRLRRLFFNLAEANTPSNLEYRMMPYVMKRLFYSGFKVGLDKNFNIIAYRGQKPGKKLPVLCAHMDTVNKNPKTVKLELVYNSLKRIIHTTKCREVLGGDDKCGVAIILRLAEIAKDENLNFIALFTRKEETGTGASHLNESFFDMAKYAIVIDRQGAEDIVTKIYGTTLCTPQFAKWVASNAPLGTKPTIIDSCGSDARPLSDMINAVNISCGYYASHSAAEFVSIDDMYNSMIWVKNMLKNPYCEIPSQKAV